MRWALSFTDNYGVGDVDRLLAQLPSWRRSKALKYKKTEGQINSACSYLLLQYLLKEEFGIVEGEEFHYNDHGKPFLTSRSEVFFSMSHCQGAVACAVSGSPIGIDVETFRKAKTEILDYVCDEEEKERILTSPNPDKEFTKLWVQKESIFKLLGTGINHNVKNIIKDTSSMLKTEIHVKGAYVVALTY